MLQVFDNLKYIDLTNSIYLTETPDFSRVANLELLILNGCTQLSKIHWSIGYLYKLTGLSLENCINLERFPSLDQLVSLQTLILSGCSKLEKFPDITQQKPCLLNLCLDGTAITELPSSIGYAAQLVVLNLKNCINLRSFSSSVCKLTRLETLSLSGCLDLGKFQENALPWSLDRLCSLRRLELQNCWRLTALPALPSSLELVNASDCKSLEEIAAPQSVFSAFRGCIFGNCFKLISKYQSMMEGDLLRMATNVDKERWRSTYKEVSI